MDAKELTLQIQTKGIWYQVYKSDRIDHMEDWGTFCTEAGEGDWLLTDDPDGPKLVTVLYERQDEHMVVIHQLGDQYFRLLGEYDSWNGTTWDWAEYEEVIPKTVTKVEYVKA